MDMAANHKFNPFTPHQPIDPQFFAGRIDEVSKVSSALNQTRHQKTHHVLLTGERGIGKSSLALYAQYLGRQPNSILRTDFHFATSYYTVEKNQTMADVCRGLTSKLIDGIDHSLAKKCVEKLKDLKLHFSVHVPGVGEVGLSPGYEHQAQGYLHADFVKAVEETWDEIKETHNGIVLIIDELHNLESFRGAGSFFKVVSEGWAADGYRQIMFLATGLPRIATEISQDDPSASRIFSYVELKRMTEDESMAILHRCLADTQKTLADAAGKRIAQWSGGFPYFLHQLAYDAFEVDTNDTIDTDDATAGLFTRSLVQFGRMFFAKMYESVEGKQKQKIVDELARGINVPQTAIGLARELKIKNIHQYLRSLEDAGIVEKIKGGFRLSSELLAIYILLFKAAPRSAQKAAQESAKSTDDKDSIAVGQTQTTS